ncbi:MAG: hypothetical protein JWQ76_5683 [Ramlibacter sp.]|nr:hypothetical protein [Ramlibacter sp.]
MFDRLGIGAKLALAFGALASITVLVVLFAYLANRQVTADIRSVEASRLPAALISARARASLMRMQLHVRGYLVLGESADIDMFNVHRKQFEASLAALRSMARTWDERSAREIEQLSQDYDQWIQSPQRLFNLHDNPLKNRPALRLARIELQPRRVEVLKHIDAIMELQRRRESSAAARRQLEQLGAFQSSFDAMATNLMAYAASGELNFKLAYGPQLATNAAQWQVLLSTREARAAEWQQHLDAIAVHRAEIGNIALQIINVITGERAYEDLYLFRSEAEPQAQKLLDTLERVTKRHEAALQTDLEHARDSLNTARLPATVGGMLAILLAVALALLCQHYIAGPVRRLTSLAEQVAVGVMSREDSQARDEIGRLAHMIQTRLTKEELQLLMASVSDAIWSAEVRGGRFAYRYISPAIERIAGLPAEALYASPRLWMDMVHPEDQSAHRAAAARITSGSSDREEMEYRVVRPDGSMLWMRDSIRATRFTDDLVQLYGVVSDVTSRKQAERAVRESEARFRALTELSSDWYWKQDANLRFVYLSGEVFDKAGWTADSSIGKTRQDIEALTLLSCTWAEHQAVLDARQPFRDLEYTRLDCDGNARYISISGAPIFDDGGEFLGYQGVGRDITERRLADEELRQLEHQLRQAQRLEAVGTLAGGIAHDFNNILGAILGYGEMAMRDAPAQSRLRRDLDSIMAAGERGRVLVDRILMFSRSAVGEKILVPVQDVIREALDLIVAKLPQGVHVHANLRAGSAAMLGDPTQVHQVLINLATNALQAMPHGGTLGVTLTVEQVEAPRAAMCGALSAGEYLLLVVGDTGVGMSTSVLERIFDPFFTTKEVGVGTGLGLSLVHGIVTNVGGAVDIQTRLGAGSIFKVYLPRSGDAAALEPGDQTELSRGHGEAILLVDDEEPLVRLTCDNLSSLGYVPVPFTSPVRALEAFHAEPGRFGAALIDERMAGISGISVVREIRASRRDIPILLVTGYIGEDLLANARAAGCSDVLKKPLPFRELAARLAQALGECAGDSGEEESDTSREQARPALLE